MVLVSAIARQIPRRGVISTHLAFVRFMGQIITVFQSVHAEAAVSVLVTHDLLRQSHNILINSQDRQ